VPGGYLRVERTPDVIIGVLAVVGSHALGLRHAVVLRNPAGGDDRTGAPVDVHVACHNRRAPQQRCNKQVCGGCALRRQGPLLYKPDAASGTRSVFA